MAQQRSAPRRWEPMVITAATTTAATGTLTVTRSAQISIRTELWLARAAARPDLTAVRSQIGRRFAFGIFVFES